MPNVPPSQPANISTLNTSVALPRSCSQRRPARQSCGQLAKIFRQHHSIHKNLTPSQDSHKISTGSSSILHILIKNKSLDGTESKVRSFIQPQCPQATTKRQQLVFRTQIFTRSNTPDSDYCGRLNHNSSECWRASKSCHICGQSRWQERTHGSQLN